MKHLAVLIFLIGILGFSSCERTPRKPPAGIEWGRIYEVPPFTKNDNKKLPLRWSVRFALAIDERRGICGSHAMLVVRPGDVVFVKFDDEVTANLLIGVQGVGQKTLKRNAKPSALRFVAPGSRHQGEFTIDGEKRLFVCNHDRETIILLEARKYPR